MNGVPITIVGVAAEGFEGADAVIRPISGFPCRTAWARTRGSNPPEDSFKIYRENETWWCLRMLGRLAPGETKAQAVAQLQATFQTAAYVSLGYLFSAQSEILCGT